MTELIHATDAVVEDLKKVLENQGIKETSLRIDANAG